MAILIAVDQWRSYLQLGEFLIFTDQRSLIHLSDQRLHTTWQQKVFTKLLGLQYQIVYKPGSENRVADALSRRGCQQELSAMSNAVPSWLLDIKSSYDKDDKATTLLSKLVVDSAAEPSYTLQQGLLRYKGRIWVGSDKALQLKIIEAFHSSPVGGHSGIPATYQRIKALFAWTGLKTMVTQFVKSCPTCQQAKPDRSKYPGLLQPLPVPTMAWQSVSMDFVEGLPMSGGKNCILVIVDRFSKYSHFIPMSHPFTAFSVAKLFIANVYKLHGLPVFIISDCDRVFTSHLWQELFRLAGVSLKMSSAYHPQTDGQTERVNQCLETFLRCFVSASPSKWSDWLYLAEYWYNTTWHSSLGYSPFYVLYGHQPRHFGISEGDAISSVSLSDWFKDKHLMTSLIQQHLTRAQKRMKAQTDQHRSERQFAVGDWVYLKLLPYVQASLAPRANQKLAGIQIFWSLSGSGTSGGSSVQITTSLVDYNTSCVPCVSAEVSIARDSGSCYSSSFPGWIANSSEDFAAPHFYFIDDSYSSSACPMVRLPSFSSHLGRHGGPQAAFSACSCLGTSASSRGEC